jgi:hypothetical protein
MSFAGDAVQQADQIIRCESREVNGRNHWFLICCMLLVALSIACTREGKAERLLATAKEQVEQGELEQAVALYDRLLEEFADTEAAKSAKREAVLYRGLADAVQSYPARTARDQVVETARAIQRYRGARRTWPGTLEDLVPQHLRKVPIDPWGRQLFYAAKKSGRGYYLACYGEDGQSGGTQDDADWLVEDGAFVRKLSRELR